MKKFNRRAMRRAFWAAFGRLIGVMLGAGAGSLLYHIIGGGIHGLGIAGLLVVVGFSMTLFAEYEREIDP